MKCVLVPVSVQQISRFEQIRHVWSNSSIRSSNWLPLNPVGVDENWHALAHSCRVRKQFNWLRGQIIWDEMITIRFGWRGDSLIASKSPKLWAIMICCHGMFGGADHQKGGCDSHCGVDSLGGCVGSWGVAGSEVRFVLGLCWIVLIPVPCKCGVLYPNSTGRNGKGCWIWPSLWEKSRRPMGQTRDWTWAVFRVLSSLSSSFSFIIIWLLIFIFSLSSSFSSFSLSDLDLHWRMFKEKNMLAWLTDISMSSRVFTMVADHWYV